MIARQFGALFSISMLRLRRSRFMLTALLLAAAPLALLGIMAIAGAPLEGAERFTNIYRTLLYAVYLHFIVFFIANVLGFAASRQDLDEQTLHHLLLQPAPRWLIMLAKFCAFLALSGGLIAVSVWLFYLGLSALAFGLEETVVNQFQEGRLWGLAKESLVLLLGLAGYGVIAMLFGSIFKSMTYAGFVFLWEALLPFLPASLKPLTLAHYLQSLLPGTQRRQGVFEMLGEPASTETSLAVVSGLTLTCFAVATIVFYFRECAYGEEA